MRKYIWILLIILITMSGCQPASQDEIGLPDALAREPDKNDGRGNNNEPSTTNSLYDNLDIPESYSIPDIVCPSGELTICVDANIKVPNVSLPIVRVRKTGFTSSQIEHYAEVLFGNATLVANDSIYRIPTKGYLQREINALQADITSWNADIQSKYEIYNSKEEAQEGLSKLIEQMDSAPDTLPGITPEYSLTDEISRYLAMPDNQTFSSIDIFQPDSQSAELTYTRDSFLNVGDVTGGVKEDIGGLVSISEEDACTFAKQTLTDLELDDFICAGSATMKYEFGAKGTYIFYFTRQVNGAMETYTNEAAYISTSRNAIEEEATSQEDIQTWEYEKIYVLVDDEGILSFSYISPSEVTEIIADQATELIPFSEIVNIFEQNISRIDQPDYGAMSYTRVYYITDIVLGLMSVPEEDYETALLKPVWDFMGYTNINNVEACLNRYESFFTINASDGSIINRSNKYELYD